MGQIIRQSRLDPAADLNTAFNRANVKRLIAEHSNRLFDEDYRDRMGLQTPGMPFIPSGPFREKEGSLLPQINIPTDEYLRRYWPPDEGPLPVRLHAPLRAQ